MTFAEKRACQTETGCRLLDFQADEFVKDFNEPYKANARARFVEYEVADCADKAQVLDEEGRDPGTTYIDGTQISQCPRIASIMFKVLDSLEARNA